MTRKSSKHLCTTHGNTGQLFRPYQVLSAACTVITTGDRTVTTECRAETLPLTTNPYCTQVMPI